MSTPRPFVLTSFTSNPVLLPTGRSRFVRDRAFGAGASGAVAVAANAIAPPVAAFGLEPREGRPRRPAPEFWRGSRRAAPRALLGILVARARTSVQGGACILLVIALGVLACPARAAVSISPVTIELTGSPGDTGAGSWQIGNTGGEPVDVAVSAIRYSDYVTGNTLAPAPSWLVLSRDSLALAPGQRSSVQWTLTVPDSLAGEELVMVFFAEQPRGGGGVQGRIGTAFYLGAAGTLRPELSLQSCRAVRDAQGSLRFYLVIRNAGNVHLRPRGEFVIVDSDGNRAGAAPLEVGLPVLPRNTEMFTTKPVSPRVRPGDYTVRWRLVTGDVDGRPGPELNGEFPLRQE